MGRSQTHIALADRGIETAASHVSNTCLTDPQDPVALESQLDETRPSRTEQPSAEPEHLFTCLLSLQQQAADFELGLDEVLDLLVQHACALTRADAAAVALLQTNGLACRARVGSMAPDLGAAVDLGSSFSGQSFSTGEVLCCEDTEDYPRIHRAGCRTLGIRSILVAPIEQDHRSIGIVEVFSDSPERFGTNERCTLALLAEQVTEVLRIRAISTPLPPPELVPSHSEVVPSLSAALPTTNLAQMAAPQGMDWGLPETIASKKIVQEGSIVEWPRPRRRILPWMIGLFVLSLIYVAGPFVALLRTPPTPSAQPPHPTEATPSPPAPAPSLPPTVDAGPALLTGVKHRSQPDFTSIAIELSHRARVTGEQLSDPERIYFDLAETRLAPHVLGGTIPVGDRLVNRLRLAQNSPAVARVVIDLNRACTYAYSISETPPYRLSVELRAAD